MSREKGPTFEQTIELRASSEQVWEYLVSPELVGKYHLAPLMSLVLEEGGEIVYGTAQDAMISGTVRTVETGRLLVHTFRFGGGSAGEEDDPETLVEYSLEDNDDGSALTVRHSGFPEENQTYADICGGWPIILQQLKSALEGDTEVL